MAGQVDIAMILEVYRSMNDQQLLEFAEKDGPGLTADAFLALRDELKRRDIGEKVISKVEQEIILQHSLSVRRMEEDFNNELLVKAYRLAFELKKERKSDYEIHNALAEIGVQSDYAFYIIKSLEDKLLGLIESASNDMLVGLVIGGIGLIAVYISVQIEHFVIGALLLLIIGVIRAIVSANRKRHFEELLIVLQEEKNEAAGNEEVQG
jgi:hypothetical protein